LGFPSFFKFTLIFGVTFMSRLKNMLHQIKIESKSHQNLIKLRSKSQSKSNQLQNPNPNPNQVAQELVDADRCSLFMVDRESNELFANSAGTSSNESSIDTPTPYPHTHPHLIQSP
jgi:hypothetical protein